MADKKGSGNSEGKETDQKKKIMRATVADSGADLQATRSFAGQVRNEKPKNKKRDLNHEGDDTDT